MQITNASAPFPNAIAPFSPKVDQPSSGVTKDILASSFAPLNEIEPLVSSQNSLSEKAIVYTPQTLIQTKFSGDSAAPLPLQAVTRDGSLTGQVAEPVTGEPETVNKQASPGGSEENSQPDIAVSGNDTSNDRPIVVAGDIEGENPAGEEGAAQPSSDESSPDSTTSVGLTPDEREIVGELAARDREVRTHEQQHQSVGGQYAGAASFSYQTGPDGVQYAVGGEVSIDISAVPNDPQATIDKMRTVKNAALAPAEPSAQDRSVASSANRIIMQAQAELAAERAEEFQAIRSDTQERQAEAAESREQQQDDQEGRRPSIAEGVRTYESLIALGQQYENGLNPEINLDELV